jgi:hypothetical protein
VLFLLFPPAGYAQKSDFNSFYAKFKKAVTSRNTNSIRDLMSSNFRWALDDHLSRDEALKYIDNGKKWGKIRSALAKPPRRCKEPYCNHDSRFQSGYFLLTSSFTILFMQENGEWKWAGVLGD